MLVTETQLSPMCHRCSAVCTTCINVYTFFPELFLTAEFMRNLKEEMKLRPFFVCVCALLSAGVGRTGVFITLSIVLERMRYEGVVDLFQTVKTLRTQRPAMVQTEVRTGSEKERTPDTCGDRRGRC